MPTLKLFDAVSKPAVFPCFIKSHSKIESGSSTPYEISSWPAEKCTRKWSQEVLVCADLVTPMQGQGQRKWYKMVRVNGAYKHGRFLEKMVTKFTCNVQR